MVAEAVGDGLGVAVGVAPAGCVGVGSGMGVGVHRITGGRVGVSTGSTFTPVIGTAPVTMLPMRQARRKKAAADAARLWSGAGLCTSLPPVNCLIAAAATAMRHAKSATRKMLRFR
jgi:hypothetical protein